MRARRAAVIAAWLCSLAVAAAVALHARYITDLSAFLPAHPTAQQRILVEQLREGPASRLLLVGIEGGSRLARAAVSSEMARRLRAESEFSSVSNGQEASADRDREILFAHRYLLSDATDSRHFSAAGLEAAMRETIVGFMRSLSATADSRISPARTTVNSTAICDGVSPAPAWVPRRRRETCPTTARSRSVCCSSSSPALSRRCAGFGLLAVGTGTASSR